MDSVLAFSRESSVLPRVVPRVQFYGGSAFAFRAAITMNQHIKTRYTVKESRNEIIEDVSMQLSDGGNSVNHQSKLIDSSKPPLSPLPRLLIGRMYP